MFGVRLGLGVGSAVAHHRHCEVVLVITKAEWDAMKSNERNAIVAHTILKPPIFVSGNPLNEGRFLEWWNQTGKPELYVCADSEDGTFSSYGDKKVLAQAHWNWNGGVPFHCPTSRMFSPTTDRNACALVLDEIASLNLSIEFIDAITDESDPPLCGAGERANLFYGILVDPDTICYCAVKAVENGA